MSNKEEWRPVVGSEGRNEVSNLGRVRSLDRYVGNAHGTKSLKKGQMLSLSSNPKGYLSTGVVCRETGKQKRRQVHRMVAEAFHGLSDKPQVNHINSDPSDNRPSNLEWATQQENIDHAKAQGKFDSRVNKNRIVKLLPEDVDDIKVLLADGNFTQQCIADIFKVSRQLINDIHNNRAWAVA